MLSHNNIFLMTDVLKKNNSYAQSIFRKYRGVFQVTSGRVATFKLSNSQYNIDTNQPGFTGEVLGPGKGYMVASAICHVSWDVAVTWVMRVTCWKSQERDALRAAVIMKTSTCHGTLTQSYRNQAGSKRCRTTAK